MAIGSNPVEVKKDSRIWTIGWSRVEDWFWAPSKEICARLGTSPGTPFDPRQTLSTLLLQQHSKAWESFSLTVLLSGLYIFRDLLGIYCAKWTVLDCEIVVYLWRKHLRKRLPMLQEAMHGVFMKCPDIRFRRVRNALKQRV